jgi:RNA polymerase sigma-70 factor (ECF subfamily)
MWRRFDQFELGTDFVAWATTIALYEAKNFQRILGRSRVVFDEELMETLAVARVQDLQHHDTRLDALEECVQKLDPSSRELVDAVYSRGEDVKGLAQREGRAPQTFYNRLNFIRRVLTDCMRQRVAGSSL